MSVSLWTGPRHPIISPNIVHGLLGGALLKVDKKPFVTIFNKEGIIREGIDDVKDGPIVHPEEVRDWLVYLCVDHGFEKIIPN